MFDCQLCGTSYQMGPDLYTGHTIVRYQLSVCNTCYQSNWDGWGTVAEPALVAHLENRGIPLPERNERGYYPRD